MKITEAYKNKEEIIKKCKENNACINEFAKLISAITQIDFENVLLANFDWCVKKNILKEWLPEKLPDCIKLNCINCKKLKKLPELPNCEILDCYGCKNLQQLPNLPKCKQLYCSKCEKLEQLPELQNCEILECKGCNNLQQLPNLSKCKELDYSKCEKLEQLPELQNCEVRIVKYGRVIESPNLPKNKQLFKK